MCDMVSMATAVMGMVQSVQGFKDAKSDQRKVQRMEDANLAGVYEENNRRMGNVRQGEADQKSDRVRQAEYEMGTLVATVGEVGITEGSAAALAREIGGMEGIDLSRISRSATEAIHTIEVDNDNARLGHKQATTAAFEAAKAARSSMYYGGLIGAAQIGSSIYSDIAAKRAAEVVPSTTGTSPSPAATGDAPTNNRQAGSTGLVY